MQKLVFRNGAGNEIDLTADNFGITNWAGLSNTPLNIQTQQVPFEDGGVFLDALMEQREIDVTVAINDNNNLELRYQLKRELISALNPKLGEGVLIYTNDYLSRQIHAVPQIPLFENKNSNDKGTLKASVTFSCPSPYWEDVEETEVNVSKFGTVVNNNGDVDSEVKITFEREGDNKTYDSPDIYNEANGNYLKINGEYSTPIVVDTNKGQKSAYYQGLNLKELEKNEPVSKLQYSTSFDSVLFLQGGALKKILQNGEYETIKMNVSSFSIFEDMILAQALDSESEEYVDMVTFDLVNWQTVSAGWLAMQKMSENVYEIYRFGDSIESATLTIQNGVITISEWIEESYFSNFSSFLFSFGVIVYNPFLKGIVVFGRPNDPSEAVRCYIKKNNVWSKKGVVSYPSNLGFYGFIEETNTMVIYGTQYGTISRSVDGVTWENYTITGQINSMNYIKERGYYVAVGRDLHNYSPLIATSKDLINWEYINYKGYAKTGASGYFTNLVFDSKKNIFYIESSYTDRNDTPVFLIETNLADSVNVISKTEGNMDFKLIMGNNKIYINGDVKCKLSYRQKYIGV